MKLNTMEVKMENKGWELFTHRVSMGLNNIDGLFWKLELLAYTDDERKAVRGMPIGFITKKGFVSNPKDTEFIYRMVWDEDDSVAFFRRKK